MPLDPSVLLRQTRAPQWPDPIEEYKGFLSLRQMMDLGRQRQVLLQQNELENEQKRRKLADEQQLRQVLSTNEIPEKASLPQLMKLGIGFEPAMKILTDQRLLGTATATQATAELTRQKTQGELDTKEQQRVADTLYGVRNIPDPAKRQAAMDILAMSELDPRLKGEFASFSGMAAPSQPLGIQRAGQPTPVIEPEFRARYAAGYNPTQLQALLGNEATATRADAEEKRRVEAAKTKATIDALKITEEQGKQAGAMLGFVSDQPSLTKWYNEIPGEWRARVGPPPTYNEATMTRLGRMFTTQEQQQTAAAAEATRAETLRHHKALEEEATAGLTMADLTPDALNMAADNFATKGVMLPLGMGKAATEMRRAIINKAAERHPDLAGNQAAYGANVQSLNALQKQRDAIGAFEQTAMKNLDLFLKTVKPIIDTGAPWLNKPFRTAVRQGTSDPKFLAFQAARRVAVNEIAKITSNPNLAGSLSDSARHEVESFIPEDATAKEIIAVVNILKQDVGNRVQSMDEQIGAIKKRISPRSTRDEAPTSSATAPSPVMGAGAVVVKDPQSGKSFSFPNQAAADAFKQVRGIR
jgi:hypothetical protein